MAKKVNFDQSQKLDITCRRGDSFSMTITLKDSSGTGFRIVTDDYSFVMQVRSSLRSAQSKGTSGLVCLLLVLGQCKKKRRWIDVLEEFTLDDSGNLTIRATAETMRFVPAGSYIYDLQQIKPNATTGVDDHKTILRGSFKVNEDVSDATPTPAPRR